MLKSHFASLYSRWVLYHFGFNELIALFVEIITTGFEWKGISLCSVGFIPRIYQSVTSIPSNTSTARFPTIPSQVHMRRSPLQIKNGTMSSLFTASWTSVYNAGDLIDLIDSFQAEGSKSLLVKFGPAPISNKLATVNEAFYVTLI